MKNANLLAVIVFSVLFCAASALAVLLYMNTRETAPVTTSSTTQTSSSPVPNSSSKTTVNAIQTPNKTVSVTTSATQGMFPADLNRIQKEELMQISGIGEGKAAAIVAYRAKLGKFTAMEQLLQVDGIGQKTYEMLCGYLYISNADTVITTTSVRQTTQKHTETSAKTTTSPPKTTQTTLRQRRRVNISTATAEELEDALLISRELAESIVKLRRDIQYFSNIHELLHADGMTFAQFNEIKAYVYVE